MSVRLSALCCVVSNCTVQCSIVQSYLYVVHFLTLHNHTPSVLILIIIVSDINLYYVIFLFFLLQGRFVKKEDEELMKELLSK